MIVMFPLLTDDTVSPNVVPGVVKALERFALIYKMDYILKWGGMPADSRIIGFAKDNLGILARQYNLPGLATVAESENISEAGKGIFGSQTTTSTSGMSGGKFSNTNKVDIQLPSVTSAVKDTLGIADTGYKLTRGIYKDLISPTGLTPGERKEKEADYAHGRVWNQKPLTPDRKVDINSTDLRSNLSVEPTWVTVQSRKGSSVIGIKVVPYSINAAPFIDRVSRDMSLNIFDELIERYERSVSKLFFNIMRNMKIPFLKRAPLAADPFKDVIYARSKYKGNVFTLFNLASLKAENAFQSSGGVDKLFRLGWNSIVIADDVTKRAIFCMKEFGGVCSVINYAYIYASLGSEYAKEYGNLEDLKKSSSPFFKSKIKAQRFIGESIALEYMERFKNLGIPCVDGDCK